MRFASCLLIAGLSVCFAGDAPAQSAERVLFDFTPGGVVGRWQIVNDGVMGGRSTSRAEMLASGQIRFTGNLSLENNGGFASVRSISTEALGLNNGDEIVMLVKGDGRTYTLNLYLPERRTAFSHKLDFQTNAGQWVEVRLPVKRFVAHSFGRPVPGAVLDPARVSSLGIMIGDKRPGGFQLIVDTIKVVRSGR